MSGERTTAKFSLPGEVALIAGLLINSFAFTLFVKSGLGMGVLGGVPYVLSLIMPALSMGTWNMLAQCFWMMVLIVALRRFRPGYLISFGLGAVFGYLLNMWEWALAGLPLSLPFRILWYSIGFCTMTFGVALFIRCKLPVMPFDTVPREFILVKGWPVRWVRTTFDVTNFVIMLTLGLVFLGKPVGIGVGTVIHALLMGTGAGMMVNWLDRHVDIQPRIAWLGRLA